ncbi:MAG TPA: hypothetical protein VNT55_16380 [Baekduia sp.]|nr:hypothetical protein [Baekduia sp.]
MNNVRLAALVAALLSLLVPAATASAGIWSPTASGTTANITAIDDVAAGTLVYGTASGQLLKNGTVRSTNPGFSINDVALNPSGTVGLAAASNGRLLRSADGGDTWAVKALTNTSYTQSPVCAGSPGGPVPKTYTPTGNLFGVAWASDTVAYVVAEDQGVVLKTTDGGNTWSDASRQADNTCRVDTNGDILTDVAALPGSDLAWFVDDGFGASSITTNGLTSTTLRRSDSAVNCFDHRPRLALDTDNPNRAFMVDRCSGSLAWGFTEDGGTSWDLSRNYFAGEGSSLNGLNDVAIAGGTAIAAGNSGALLVAPNGADAYFQRADGALGTTDWLSVSKRDATHAAAGGSGGALVVTDQATTIPDIVAPSGTVSGPLTAVAGVPQTYTANVADNAGGTGIDPASFAWTATGLPTATGNPAAITFPAAGFYAITVTFKDRAGNTATSGIAVQVSAPPVVKPPVVTTPGTKTASATVPGAKITLGVPKTCVAPGQTFTVTLTWKKQKRKGNRFVKVRRADFYIGSKRVKIDKKAPFRQTLKVTASTKPGSSITVKARAFIKVTKGKSPTKSIKTTVKVC